MIKKILVLTLFIILGKFHIRILWSKKTPNSMHFKFELCQYFETSHSVKAHFREVIPTVCNACQMPTFIYMHFV